MFRNSFLFFFSQLNFAVYFRFNIEFVDITNTQQIIETETIYALQLHFKCTSLGWQGPAVGADQATAAPCGV